MKMDKRFSRMLRKREEAINNGEFNDCDKIILLEIIEGDASYNTKMHRIALNILSNDAWEGSVQAAEKLIEMYTKIGFKFVETKIHKIDDVQYLRLELIR